MIDLSFMFVVDLLVVDLLAVDLVVLTKLQFGNVSMPLDFRR